MTLPVSWLLKLGFGERAATLAAWLIPLLLVSLALAVLWGRGEHFRAASEAANARTAAQVNEYRKAYRTAYVRAWAAKQAEEARTRTAKEKADAEFIAALEGDRDRAAAYAAANRCVRAQTDRTDPGAAGAAGMPGTGEAAREPERTGALAELVGISAGDFAICTANSRRLENAVGWGEDYESTSVGAALRQKP